jgi:hypothetical protein
MMMLCCMARSMILRLSWEQWLSTMSRIGSPEVFCVVAWGINDFSNHSAPIKSSVQPLGDVPTLRYL